MNFYGRPFSFVLIRFGDDSYNVLGSKLDLKIILFIAFVCSLFFFLTLSVL